MSINAMFLRKYTKKTALNAPELTADVSLHFPVILIVIGALKCTLFVFLMYQVSLYCISFLIPYCYFTS
jgi:DUF4097 and DUF4098 domain-containing protein YvlB